MNDLNSLLVEGNATRDPDLKYLPSGTAVCTFSIASNRSFKKDDGYEKEVSFFEVEAWGKLAEAISKNMHKGRGCRVVGRIKQEHWQKDGATHSKVKIVAEHCEFKWEDKDKKQTEQKQQNDESLPPDYDDEIPFD